MKKFLQSILGALALFFISSGAFANDYVKFKGWKQAETTHFRFIYEAASEPAAQAYAKIADEAWEKIARIYSMPQEDKCLRIQPTQHCKCLHIFYSTRNYNV